MKKTHIIVTLALLLFTAVLLVSCNNGTKNPEDTTKVSEITTTEEITTVAEEKTTAEDSEGTTDEETTENVTAKDTDSEESTTEETTVEEPTTEETTTEEETDIGVIEIPLDVENIVNKYIKSANQTTVESVTDEELGRNVLKLSTNIENANDPFAELSFKQIGKITTGKYCSANQYKVVILKMKAENCPTGRFELFYYTGNNTYVQGGMSMTKIYDNSGTEWQYIYFDFSDTDNWRGTINGFRFDYLFSSNVKGSSVSIASVILAENTDAALKYMGYNVGLDELDTLAPEAQEKVDELLSGGVPEGKYDSYTPLTATDEDSTLNMWFDHTYTKTPRSVVIPGEMKTYRMTLAKNEIEACQMLLSSTVAHNGFTVELTDFVNDYGDIMTAQLLYGYYFEVEGYNVVDPVIPVENGKTFDLAENTNMAFLVKAFSKENTPAGEYSATITVKDSDGKEIKKATVFAYVWNFVLPEETSCKTLADISWWNIYVMHKCYEGDDGLLYKLYYDMLLENRVCGYTLPYNKEGKDNPNELFSDSRIIEYLNNPRVVAFQTIGWKNDLTAEKLAKAYSYLSANEAWLNKAYFYPIDEPMDTDDLDKINYYAQLIKDNYSENYKLIAPMHINYALDSENKIDYFEYVKDAVNAWCPHTYFYNSFDDYRMDNRLTLWTSAALDKNLGTFEERMAAQQSEGDEVWWYVTRRPSYPEITLTMETQAVKYRILFWQQKYYNVDGFLYYSVNDWYGSNEEDMGWNSKHENDPAQDFNVYGNGVLLYCGRFVGINGPVESIRLECVRDGIEDYEYLTILEEELGKETVDNIISQLTTSLAKYKNDEEFFTALRESLGALVEKTVNESAE